MNGLNERLVQLKAEMAAMDRRLTDQEASVRWSRWLLITLLVEQTAAIVGLVLAR